MRDVHLGTLQCQGPRHVWDGPWWGSRKFQSSDRRQSSPTTLFRDVRYQRVVFGQERVKISNLQALVRSRPDQRGLRSKEPAEEGHRSVTKGDTHIPRVRGEDFPTPV